jgi:hypothetical protein
MSLMVPNQDSIRKTSFLASCPASGLKNSLSASSCAITEAKLLSRKLARWLTTVLSPQLFAAIRITNGRGPEAAEFDAFHVTLTLALAFRQLPLPTSGGRKKADRASWRRGRYRRWANANN